jgi:flavin reductase (DIM6/NTAB) family NADH-FMN oxidoreductase RutF
MKIAATGASGSVSSRLAVELDDTGSVTGLDTRELSWDEQYKLISNTVIPRPIALVSTDGPAGRNAAPFSFFNAVALGPPMVMFSVGPTKFEKAGQEKDTLRNIRETGEFVLQLVDDANKDRMNLCVPEYGSEIDEMERAGFATAPSVRIKAPRIVDCPVQFECVVSGIHTLGETPYHMVIGEIVYAHYRSGILNQRLHVDMLAMNPIGRLSNPGMYARITDHFQLLPPVSSN